MLGVAGAELLLGRDFGVFPVLTIPLGWILAVSFALAPKVSPTLRLAVLLVGTGLFFAFL